MGQLLAAVRSLGAAMLDPWVAVDAEDRIVEHNALFRELFPREVARELVGRTCGELLRLSATARELAAAEGPVRLDEQEAEVHGSRLRLIVSAAPLALEGDRPGTLLILRNVTEEARIQASYQQLEDTTRRQCEDLEQRLDERTRDLLTANDLINRLEGELARYKRGEV
ncbi:MAG: PAS domain-containing protein [Myxococcota bacterium]|nr:PAS domain-containing protein [Myxococcota bacterium]